MRKCFCFLLYICLFLFFCFLTTLHAQHTSRALGSKSFVFFSAAADRHLFELNLSVMSSYSGQKCLSLKWVCVHGLEARKSGNQSVLLQHFPHTFHLCSKLNKPQWVPFTLNKTSRWQNFFTANNLCPRCRFNGLFPPSVFFHSMSPPGVPWVYPPTQTHTVPSHRHHLDTYFYF